jgi:hypothetical protein
MQLGEGRQGKEGITPSFGPDLFRGALALAFSRDGPATPIAACQLNMSPCARGAVGATLQAALAPGRATEQL